MNRMIDTTLIDRLTVLANKEKKLKVNKSVSIEGIPKFRMIICTRLKALEKGASKKENRRDYYEIQKNG